MAANIKTPEKVKPSLTIDPTAVKDKDGDSSTIRSEICLSPSWSDHGEKERKRAKKIREKEKKKREEEKREAERKAKKEEERQKAAVAKAMKRDGRLSRRPPPAAMDTQRMPSELRRSSMISYTSGQTSQESSRAPSRERRRLSGISIGSSKSKTYSQSSPPTSTEIDGAASEEWQPVVSAAAPQLPALHGIDWHSRNGSSRGSKSNSWGSDDSYKRELSRFSRRLSRGSPKTSPQQASFNESSRPSSQVLAPGRPLLRSQTDIDIARASLDSPVVKEVEQALAEMKISNDRQGPAQREIARLNQYASTNGQIPDAPKVSHDHDTMNGTASANLRSSTRRKEQKQPHNLLHLHPTSRPSLDGSSYVHRQRMYQQQRSLVGFQEEEAVRDANRNMDMEEVSQLAAEQPPHLVRDDEQLRQNLRSTTLNGHATKAHDVRSKNEQPDQYHKFLRESRNLDTADKPQQQTTSKMDRILGFGRRPKPSKQSSTISHRSGGSEGSETVVPSQLPSMELPRQEANAPRPSKKERMIGEPNASTSTQTPKARSKLSQAIVDKEISPKAKERPSVQVHSRSSQSTTIVMTSSPREDRSTRAENQSSVSQPDAEAPPEPEQAPLVRSHSRTRTSSSQLLNDNITIARPIARSTTAPVLPTINMQSFQSTADDLAYVTLKEATSPNSPNSGESFTTSRGSSPRTKGPRSPTSPKAPLKAVPEVVVESVNGEGIVRKTSIKRPRSNPQLQSVAPTPPMPSLDFLPQLKHQPLIKPKLRSSLIPRNPDGSQPSPYQFPVPAAVQINGIPSSNSAPNLTPGRSWGHRPNSHHGGGSETALTQRDSRREIGNRMSTLGPFSFAGAEKELDKPLAKMFVICCSCRFWHDLPSRVYEAMAVKKTLQREKGQLMDKPKGNVEEAKLDTMIECPWCKHHMSTECCAGWTAVVYLHQRHH